MVNLMVTGRSTRVKHLSCLYFFLFMLLERVGNACAKLENGVFCGHMLRVGHAGVEVGLCSPPVVHPCCLALFMHCAVS